MPSKADVVVIGAGYTGLSAARYLASLGASVVVLDREAIGWGASSRNGGQVLTGLKIDPVTLVRRHGEARARRLFESSLLAIARLETLVTSERIECGYRRSGHVEAAAKPSHVEALREEQAILERVFGHPVELVGRSGQRSEVGSDAYHGLLVDEASAAIDPARYVAGLAEAARRAGAKLLPGVPVDRVIVRNATAKHRTVATPHGEIEAAEVMMATGGYTNGALPALARRLVPIGSYIIATEPLPEPLATALVPRRRMVFDSRNFLHFFRVTDDRRLLFGGRAEFGQPAPDTTRRAAGILRRDMIAVFPELSSINVEFAWGGNVAFTRDELPHAGRLEGSYYSGGYCGHGIAMATYLGELIARRIAGEPIDSPLMDDRFPAIPFYNGKPWFLPIVGAYYRFRDLVD